MDETVGQQLDETILKRFVGDLSRLVAARALAGEQTVYLRALIFQTRMAAEQLEKRELEITVSARRA